MNHFSVEFAKLPVKIAIIRQNVKIKPNDNPEFESFNVRNTYITLLTKINVSIPRCDNIIPMRFQTGKSDKGDSLRRLGDSGLIKAPAGDGKQPVACLKRVSAR